MTKTPSPARLADKPRILKQGTYRSFKLQKPLPSAGASLPSGYRILRRAWSVLRHNWKLFGGIMLIYGILSLVLVRGLSMGTTFNEVRDSLQGAFDGGNDVVIGSILFAYLVGSSGTATTGAAGVTQVVLAVVFSLAIIWALRNAYANEPVRIRDALYRASSPLIPFVLVVCTGLLQLLPFVVGGAVYSAITNNGGIPGTEMVVWAIVLVLLAILSLYLVVPTLMALYVVCLPNVTPLEALRAARELVRSRRWTVLRKVLLLPLVLLIVSAAVVMPVIFLAASAAIWVFFVLSLVAIPLIHAYLYGLYRELL
jgi:hypothetical protein